METRIKLYFFFCLILTIYTSTAAERIEGTYYESKDKLSTEYLNIFKNNFVTKDYQENVQICNACTYNNGKDPNIRKNIEEIIKVLVKDSLPPAMETPNQQEYDIARDIQEAANKIIIQLSLHASKITRKVLKYMENPNDTEVVIDNVLQHCALIENQNRIKEVQELADKIGLLSKNTKRLTDTIGLNSKQQSESMAIISNKITSLENLTTVVHDMLATTEKYQDSGKLDVLATTEKYQNFGELDELTTTEKYQDSGELDELTTTEKYQDYGELDELTTTEKYQDSSELYELTTTEKYQNYGELDELTTTENYHNSDEIDILATTETYQVSVSGKLEILNQVVEENVTNIKSLCDMRVPASILTSHDIWEKKKIPEKDDLDKYMIDKIGCKYEAVEYDKDHWLKAVKFDGSQLEWRLAVRARRDADVALWWDALHGFTFFVGSKNNTVSSLRQWEDYGAWEHATPEVLAEDRYVPIYFKVNHGKLTVGLECEPEPLFTKDFTAKKGQELQRLLKSWSPYGAKYLYDCPFSSIGN